MHRDPPLCSGPAGIYLHFPFCSVRCSYCDFPTVAGRDERIEPYLGALEFEIGHFQQELPPEIDTVYLGGGTPSRMTPEQVARVLEVVRARFELSREAEVTLEANPEDLGRDRLIGYRQAGVTRLSVGVRRLNSFGNPGIFTSGGEPQIPGR